MELLYEAETKGVPVATIVDELPIPPDAYALAVALGVGEMLPEADALISKFTQPAWPIERMPMIDRIVLRMAIFELTHRLDVDRAVVLDEAVELAKVFSTDDSGKFVNGMLRSIAQELGR